MFWNKIVQVDMFEFIGAENIIIDFVVKEYSSTTRCDS
jgi:hypothetical protein